jgi:hypothetical protein
MDRESLRALAGRVSEIAALDIQNTNRALQRAVNSLRMIRPVVLLDELPWNQLNGDGELTLECRDPFLRQAEQAFRQTLYKWEHCRGDMIVDPYYRLEGLSRWGIRRDRAGGNASADGDNNIVSHHYLDQLPDERSLEKLRCRKCWWTTR